MSFTKTSSLLATAALIAKVSTHGIVQGIVADGIYYPGYQPSFQYQNPPPTVAGWSIPQDSNLGFVSDYSSPDIVCHVGATPGGAYVTVAAGGTVELQWTVWPSSHKGPVMDYLASCNGDCTTVDKTALLFTKIDEAGLINGSPAPGTWASDTLIANNNSWTVTIPSQIAPGKYVLRHETIALHAAENLDGSQAYPQCVNLEITGSGTNTLPTGTVAQDFYKDTDPGILVNIYYPALTNYTIPGPALIVNAVSATQPSISGSATATAKPSSSTTPASTSGGATSKAAIPTIAHLANSTMTPASSPSTKPMTHASALPTTSSSSKPLTSSSSIAAFWYPTPMSSVAGPTAKSTSTMTSSSSSVAAFWHPTSMSSVAGPTAKSTSTMTSSSSSVDAFWHPTPMSSVAGPTSKSTSTMTSSSSAAAMSHPAPMSSVAGPAATSTSTSPMSFTSTFTGRIGKPTKFTCYIDED